VFSAPHSVFRNLAQRWRVAFRRFARRRPQATARGEGASHQRRCFKFSIDSVRVLPQHVVMRHVVERLPLSEPVFLILASIAVEPRHGYSILREVESLSGGRVRLSTGTLYGALRRLLDDGWIERFDTGDTSRDKQSYRLTSLGRRGLQQEHERLKHLARIASASLRTKEA
jgi:DNA-binding PadR family transcriptional regulator